jgi:UDP-3-O-[3-hydroxymyristoyl] glucosamine N-acyltransferase
MPYSIAEIAAALGAPAAGDLRLSITRPAEPQEAGPDDLAVAMAPAYAEYLPLGQARAAVLWDGADWQSFGLKAAILIPRPRVAMAGLTRLFDPGQDWPRGVHPLALVDPAATIGEDASVGPFAVIGAGVRIGPRARIAPHVTICAGVEIGADVTLHAGVRLQPGVRLGDRVLIHPNAVLGADGFSFVTPERSGVESVRETLGGTGQTSAQAQEWLKIQSLGGVEIGDDVEIGASSAVDAGTIRPTRVGDRCKIDNFVHIGHNVTIGRDCLLCGMVGVAGSAVVGNNVVLGGQTGVADNIFVGDNVIAGGGTKIMSNVPAGRVVLGYPAQKMTAEVESYKAIRRLPRLFAQVEALKKAISKGGVAD